VKLSNELKAALWTTLFVFVAVFSAALLGFITDVAQWAGTDDAVFPSVTPLGKAAVAALAAAASGLLNYIIRWAQSKGVLPGAGPSYGGNEAEKLHPARYARDRGESALITILVVVVIVVLVLVVVGRV